MVNLVPDTKSPAPVEVQNIEPIPVAVEAVRESPAQTEAKSIAASSQVDADVLRSSGQRRINLIWEITQAIIAVAVTLGTLGVVGTLILRGDDTATAFLLLSNAFFMIVTSYFQRTNHTRVGGVGAKDSEAR